MICPGCKTHNNKKKGNFFWGEVIQNGQIIPMKTWTLTCTNCGFVMLRGREDTSRERTKIPGVVQ